MRKWALLVVLGVSSLVGSAAAQAPVFTVVAESGAQAAGQASGVTYSAPIQPCLGDDGRVMFVTDLFGGGVPNLTSVIYAGLPGAVQPVASEGQTAPGAGGATWASLLGAFRIARGSEQMAFDGTISGADAAHDGGIWAGPPGGFTLVRREGDPAPGSPGLVYADMAGITRVDPALNDAGAVAFRAFLAGSGVTEANDEALFAGAPGAIAPVFREGDAAPGAGGDTFVDSGAPVVDSKDTFGPPSLNGSGKILFIGHLAGAGVSGVNAQGVWHGLPNAVSLAARAGQAAPGLGAGQLFRTFEIAVLNDADQIAVVSLTATALDLNHISGVWLGAPGALGKLAAQGEAAPSDPDGATFGGVYDQLRLNGAGQVAFLAGLSNAEFGIYGHDPVQGLRLLARSGTPAPGIAGQEFAPGSNDFSLFLNDQGKVLFRGTTSPATLVGLWIADVATGQVDLLAHTGAPIEIDGTTRTVANISLAVGAADHHEGGAHDGRASPFADDGNVTFSALLDGARAAVIRTGSGGGGGGGCTDLASCQAALAAALPNPAQATDRKAHKVARSLGELFGKIDKLLDKAATLEGKKRARKHAAARSKLDKLVAKATVADGKGRLGVALASITAPASALRSLVP